MDRVPPPIQTVTPKARNYSIIWKQCPHAAKARAARFPAVDGSAIDHSPNSTVEKTTPPPYHAVVCQLQGDYMNEALREENKKMRLLKFVVDLNQAVLMQQHNLTLREAFEILKNTKQAALNLFPDKESVFDLIYTPRFRRIIRDRFLIPGGKSNAAIK
jgi:hypothetical protein